MDLDVPYLRQLLASMGPYDVLGPTSSVGKLIVSVPVTVAADIERGRVEKEPASGDRYRFLRPKIVSKALAAEADRAHKTPATVVRGIAPEWLGKPHLEGKKVVRSDVLAYTRRSERVVDRVETSDCATCHARGHYTHTWSEPIRQPCPGCGGAGGRTVTKTSYSPGTTAHGQQYQEYQICWHCSGSGFITVGYEKKSEVRQCGSCGGTGKIHTTFYKMRVFYEEIRIQTEVKINEVKCLSFSELDKSGVASQRRFALEQITKKAISLLTAARSSANLQKITTTKYGIDLIWEMIVPISSYDIVIDNNYNSFSTNFSPALLSTSPYSPGRAIGYVRSVSTYGAAYCDGKMDTLNQLILDRAAHYDTLRYSDVERERNKDMLLRELLALADGHAARLTDHALGLGVLPETLRRAIRSARRARNRGRRLVDTLFALFRPDRFR